MTQASQVKCWYVTLYGRARWRKRTDVYAEARRRLASFEATPSPCEQRASVSPASGGQHASRATQSHYRYSSCSSHSRLLVAAVLRSIAHDSTSCHCTEPRASRSLHSLTGCASPPGREARARLDRARGKAAGEARVADAARAVGRHRVAVGHQRLPPRRSARRPHRRVRDAAAGERLRRSDARALQRRVPPRQRRRRARCSPCSVDATRCRCC